MGAAQNQAEVSTNVQDAEAQERDQSHSQLTCFSREWVYVFG